MDQLTDEGLDLVDYDGCSPEQWNTLIAMARDRNRLAEWKESAMTQLAKTDQLRAALKGRVEYLGHDVHEAIIEVLAKAESERDAAVPSAREESHEDGRNC